MRALEWQNEVTTDHRGTMATTQEVDRESMNYLKKKNMIVPGLVRKDSHSFQRQASI